MFGMLSVRRRLACVRAGAVALILVLAACSSVMTPRTVSPALDGDAVARAVSSHQKLIAALKIDAAENGFDSSDYYEVALAGFNYVDDECSTYFNTLFSFSRQVAASKSSLSAFAQTTNAVLQITGAASVTMTVIAQAFGLASAMTDIVAGTYLYDSKPSETHTFVQKVMAAYKGKAALERHTINSPASAYSAVRGYLNLCLPVTIEGLLVKHINDATATAKVNSTGTNIEVNVSSEVIANPDAQLKPVFVPAPDTPGIGPYEKGVKPAQWRAIQLAICAAVDGDPGTATHTAMAEFFEGYGQPDPDLVTRGIGPEQMDVLRKAVRDADERSCAEREISGPREAGALVR